MASGIYREVLGANSGGVAIFRECNQDSRLISLRSVTCTMRKTLATSNI